MTKQLDSSLSDSHFVSYDIGLAAALITLHFELLSLDRTNPRKIGFIFPRTPELEQATQEYFAGRLSVDARSFFENTKMLKNRIFSSV